MIKLSTECEKCMHSKVCKNLNNAKNVMNKLKDMQYGNGPNNDYDWDTMMKHYHVNIVFSCPDYSPSDPINHLNRDHGFDVR